MTQTNYSITAFKQIHAILILTIGFVFSFVTGFVLLFIFPIPKISFMLIVIAGFVITFLIMKKFCRIPDNVELSDTKIVSKFFGTIEFQEIKTYNFNDLSHWNTMKIKLRNGKRVVFIDDTVGNEFENFRINFWNAILESNTQKKTNIKEKDFLKSELAKPLGIVLIVMIVILIIWSILTGELTMWKIFRTVILVTILIPFFVKIFRK